MTEQLQEYLNKALYYEEIGYTQEAVQLCNKCIQAFPENRNEIEFEIAKINYRSDRQEEALLGFFSLYQKTRESELCDLILELYYFDRRQEYEQRYKENWKQLETYPHFFGTEASSEIRYYPIWASQTDIIYFDSVKRAFKIIERCRMDDREQDGKVYAAKELLWLEDLLKLEQTTRMINPFMDMENPLLLIYHEETWELLLQLADLKQLLDFDRIVFYQDISLLEDSLVKDGIRFPNVVVGNKLEEVFRILDCANEKLGQAWEQYKAEALDYYKANDAEVIRHIKEGKPRILFITSRFTTVLQYHIRDCRKAAEAMELETELFIEKDRLCTGVNAVLHIKKIAEFKPDVIFIIDHFRYEHGYMEGLDQIVWMCWIQDTMPHIMNKETPGKLIERDFVINHFVTSSNVKEVGYPPSKTMEAPIPANSALYKPYELTEEEKSEYGADICMVCHAADVEEYIADLINRLKVDEQVRTAVEQLMYGYCNLVITEGVILYKKEEMYGFVEQYIKRFHNLELNGRFIDFLANEMYINFNQRVYRQAIADWLIEAGYQNLKLWGNGWLKSSKYQKYAVGAAPNGEILSKILQSTKIVLGNNFVATGAARAWETMLSGAFYMSNYVPPEDDAVDIRQVLKEGENLIIFHDKQDLLEKVKYYLSHEEERKQMAERGRQAALETMTFDAFMKKMVLYLKNSFDAKK